MKVKQLESINLSKKNFYKLELQSQLEETLHELDKALKSI